ncbi:hypothetical protein TVNIR_3295 [Thioalkalivibrio nitratireducens DSM 14787]|uniref:Uncharacterized protein n=1 Tax=Thioalkalivibrio nitratireducens (strain DSM 14787 / UNIQEM 213 / ALEN2) TaxID=1255043 RepID=L0E121_THIND|nr:hypothetical protein TVNIR_3295 [Thioalkalivibrio nitratireducens DSM 14787]
MRLLGRKKLEDLWGVDPETDRWLTGWVAEIAHARWREPSELLTQFPGARVGSSQGQFLFPVCGGGTMIETLFLFHQQVALIQALKQ